MSKTARTFELSPIASPKGTEIMVAITQPIITLSRLTKLCCIRLWPWYPSVIKSTKVSQTPAGDGTKISGTIPLRVTSNHIKKSVDNVPRVIKVSVVGRYDNICDSMRFIVFPLFQVQQEIPVIFLEC